MFLNSLFFLLANKNGLVERVFQMKKKNKNTMHFKDNLYIQTT